jgi:perosamine synthetase
MSDAIPLSRTDISQREIDAVVDVLHGQTLTAGLRLDQFEQACARLADRRHAVGVCSGAAALHCALLAAGVKPGDEVITTPFSFIASANSILYVGAKPVFVDIDPQTLNIDLTKIPAAFTARTKAILAVDCFGHPGGMPELERIARQNELVLIEDACEGFGGRLGPRSIGSFGRASVFSFYPNKPITTGEGGMIVTDDDTFAHACRSLRNQGREGNAWLAHERLGYSYRMAEMPAALGLAQLGRVEEILDARRRVANEYMERLMTHRCLILPTLGEQTAMSWFVFVVRLNDLFEPGDRDEIMRQLRAEGIGCNNYFPPIHLQPHMVQLVGHRAGDLPICEYVAARTLALPFFTRMTTRQVHRVCDALEKLLEKALLGHQGERRL